MRRQTEPEPEPEPDGLAATRTAVEPAGRGRAAAPRLAPGELVGRYRVEALLGRGGMGEVYRAADDDLARTVALKVLSGDLVVSASARARFLREARAQARVRHPNVAMVFDVGSDGDVDFFASEFIDGEDLASWLRKEPSPQDVLGAFLQAGRGLAAVHAAGLVHRDVKPSNLLRDRDGRVVVADFGLARWGDTVVEEVLHSPERGELAALTNAGAVVGTPKFMSPEQRAGAPVDARSDQFSFCVALTRALGEATADEEAATVPEPPNAERRPDAGATAPRPSRLSPRALAALRRGCSADPALRFPSMIELLDELAPPPRSGRSYGRWLGAALVAAVAGGVMLVRSVRAPVAEGDALCSAPGLQWTSDRAARIQRAFLASGSPAAGQAYAALADAATRRAQQWQEARAATCAAVARDPGAEAQRRACLGQSRAEAEAFFALAEHADLALVAGARVIPGEAPQRCGSGSGTWRPQPERRELLEPVRALRQQLTQVQALLAAFRVDVAVEQATQAVAAARKLGFPPVLAESLLALCAAAELGQDLGTARQACEEAALTADAAAHERVRAAALTTLTRAEMAMSSDRERTRDLLRRARASVQRLDDRALAADLDLSELRLLLPLDAAGRRRLRAVAEVLAQNGELPRWGEAMETLAEALADSDDVAAALEVQQQLLAAALTNYGEQSPQTVGERMRLADYLRREHRYQAAHLQQLRIDAFRSTEQGQAVLRSFFGALQPKVSRILRVTVTRPDGSRAAGASVSIGARLRGDGLYLDGVSDEWQRQVQRMATALTDATGEVSFRTDASVGVWLAAEDGVLRSAAARVPPGEAPAQLALPLRPTGSVAGVVRSARADSSYDIELSELRAAPTTMRLVVTMRSDGSFALPRVAPGRWRAVVIRRSRAQSGRLDVSGAVIEVRAGATTQVTLDGERGLRTVQVTVLPGPGMTMKLATLFALPGTVAPTTVGQMMQRAGDVMSRGRVVLANAEPAQPAALELDFGLRYLLCAIPHAADLADPRVSFDVQLNWDALPVHCAPVPIREPNELTLVIAAKPR
jgi:Protein kinase domain